MISTFPVLHLISPFFVLVLGGWGLGLFGRGTAVFSIFDAVMSYPGELMPFFQSYPRLEVLILFASVDVVTVGQPPTKHRELVIWCIRLFLGIFVLDLPPVCSS